MIAQGEVLHQHRTDYYALQAWEGQVAGLSRQLSKVTADKEDADRERQTLLDSLRASEQVRSMQSVPAHMATQRHETLSAGARSSAAMSKDGLLTVTTSEKLLICDCCASHTGMLVSHRCTSATYQRESAHSLCNMT